jgi:hypothetical protein
MNEPNCRRYALHVCKNKTKEVGRLPALGRIFIQQWVPNFD